MVNGLFGRVPGTVMMHVICNVVDRNFFFGSGTDLSDNFGSVSRPGFSYNFGSGRIWFLHIFKVVIISF